jgi:hypothetical protein
MFADLLYLVIPIIYEPKSTFMKKIFFIMLASTLLLALGSCIGDEPSGGSGTFDPGDTISKTTALAMYAHYMDSIVDKSDSAIIRQFFPAVAILKDVLKTKNLVRIKFLTCAYLDTDSIVARRNTVTILMQLKIQKGEDPPTYYYYDANSLTAFEAEAPFCPPPPGCIMPVED